MIQFRSGLYADYASIVTKSSDTLYWCTDTRQLFKGTQEYTHGTVKINAAPDETTAGVPHTLYAYNGNLYLCEGQSNGDWVWTKVADISTSAGTVTSITIGEGLTNATGDDNPITSAGTVKHAIPTGASATSDSLSDQSPDFGESFTIVGVATDKFGHAVVDTHSVTLPEETAVTVETATGTATTLQPGDTLTVITDVELGTADQSIKRTATTFTLPSDANTTYTLSSTKEGKITVTPSEGSAYDVELNGWSDLAKKSEIAAVFIYKGTVATAASLPTTAEVGWVYQVTADNSEWVCKTASTSSSDAVWEELGTTIDLSAYAQSADVIQRVTGATGEVPKFAADGTVVSTGFTLGKSVPSDAVFTDTTYDTATGSTDGLMSSSDYTKLQGIEAGAEVNTITGVKGDAEQSYRTGNVSIGLDDLGVASTTATELDYLHGKLAVTSDTLTVTGNVSGSANSATYDSAGNQISTTYATLADLEWKTFTES